MLAPLVQTGAGILQGIFGLSRAKRSQRELERLMGQSPTYEGSKSISDYYQKALANYNINPYQTSLYNQQMRNVGRATAGALGALQDRRAGVSSIARTLQAGNDASLNAAAAAESQRAQNLSQLGSASQALAGDQMKQFEINKLMPYQNRMSLLGAKAAGGTSMFNAGLSNLFGGLQGIDNTMKSVLQLGMGGAGGGLGGLLGGGGGQSSSQQSAPYFPSNSPLQIY